MARQSAMVLAMMILALPAIAAAAEGGTAASTKVAGADARAAAGASESQQRSKYGNLLSIWRYLSNKLQRESFESARCFVDKLHGQVCTAELGEKSGQKCGGVQKSHFMHRCPKLNDRAGTFVENMIDAEIKKLLAEAAEATKASDRSDLFREVNGLLKQFTEKLAEAEKDKHRTVSEDGKQNAAAVVDETAKKNPIEDEASNDDLNYIKLDGSVACMVNGAGLAMSTMDIISLHGGSPANFLDVGGASTVETMTKAFKIILGDPDAKSIFVNIFGGIARCDHIAEAVVAGVEAVGGNDAIKKPLVIRLEGTNVEKGMEIIKASGVKAFLTKDFTTGAKKAVELSK